MRRVLDSRQGGAVARAGPGSGGAGAIPALATPAASGGRLFGPAGRQDLTGCKLQGYWRTWSTTPNRVLMGARP